MAAGKISIQANDGKVAGVVFEDGASSNVTVTVPKEGGNVVTDKDATITSNLNMVGTGLRITGNFSNSTVGNRAGIQSNTTNGFTVVEVIPNGTSTYSAVDLINSSDTINHSGVYIAADSTAAKLTSFARGTGALLPMTFTAGGAERLRIDTSGNVLVTGSGGLGYGNGSGGTVTQLTSKSTAVTLNKPSGYILTNNANLNAGSTISFSVNNSTVSAFDCIVAVIAGATSANYSLSTGNGNNGLFTINLKNISASPLEEALYISFEVIKGATA